MGIRFNKRVTLLPWLKANVTKSGVSLTIGPKGKTLNVGSTGVSVNVSLGKGASYSKRIITWKKLNLLSVLGIGGAAAAAKSKKGKKKGKKGTTATSTSEISLDEAIAETEQTQQGTQPNSHEESSAQEQAGCSWGCAILGCLGMLLLLAAVVVIVILLIRSGDIDLSSLQQR